jgi:hypothetical protein
MPIGSSTKWQFRLLEPAPLALSAGRAKTDEAASFL